MRKFFILIKDFFYYVFDIETKTKKEPVMPCETCSLKDTEECAKNDCKFLEKIEMEIIKTLCGGG